jgi:hypothetical protein
VRCWPGNHFTVTTGHQLNLLTGAAASFIKCHGHQVRPPIEEPAKYDFVPVAWMATEWLAEINHFSLFGKSIPGRGRHWRPRGQLPLDGAEQLLSQLPPAPAAFTRRIQPQKPGRSRKLTDALFGSLGW